MTTPLLETQPASESAHAVSWGNVVTRATRQLRRPYVQISPGLLLFGGLVCFTVLYALLLQWLSVSGDRPEARSNTVASVAATAASPVGFAALDDDPASARGARFLYTGTWQHIRNVYDGRSQGTSSRSYHIGATAAFGFTGARLQLFGVKGPHGGYAELRIDGETYGLLRFYAPHKVPHGRVYASPVLPMGSHTVEIIVTQAPNDLPKRRFVNLDGATYAAR